MKIYLIRGVSRDEQNEVLSVQVDPNKAEDVYNSYKTKKEYCFVYIDEWEA